MERARVLLVDDNEATLTLLRAIFQRQYTVEMATGGADAIDKLKVNQYAAVLLDLRMPVVDGFSVLEFLRSHNPEVLRRVIVLTASLTRGDMARVAAFERCRVIPKPFEIDELAEAVRQCAEEPSGPRGGPIISTGMLFLLANIIRERLM